MRNLLRRLSLTTIALFFIFPLLFSQAFSEDISVSLEGVAYSSVAWGDFDNDGDLDIFLAGYSYYSGSYISIIYRNDAGVFNDILAGLPGIYNGSVAWGDYDNDGDLDIFISGYTYPTYEYVSLIYRNDGGAFTDINSGLTGVRYGSGEWGDFDNDGDLDIVMTGYTIEGEYLSKIYRNDSGIFSDIKAGLTGVYYGSASWGDYDNDNDLDILLTGASSLGYQSIIYQNNNGVFTDINAGLIGIAQGTGSWGDYDNDGDLDILTAGSGSVPQIYRNDLGIFTNINADLSALSSGSAIWGDYDNDGDLDIFFHGYSYDAGMDLSEILRNDGGVFTEIDEGLPGFDTGYARWGDYDNDGDLDLLLTGYTDSDVISKIYINEAAIPNTVPGAPANLQATVTGSGMVLSWNKSSDSQTPQDGLSYNLYIGTAPGAVNKRSPMAILPGGFRKIVKASDIKSNSWTIKKLTAGTYYWSVQAIDNNFAGSPFATPGSFVVPFSSTVSPVDDQILKVNETCIPLTVAESSTPTSRQWKYSTASGGPYDQLIAGATTTTCSHAFSAVGEYFIVCESLKGGITYTSNEIKILVTDFIEVPTISLTGVGNSSVAWGDYDNDDDLDILLTGWNAIEGDITKVFSNNFGVFDDINAGLQGIVQGSASWGDYDNDGDLDILLAGSGSTIIYHNDNGIFYDIEADLPGVNDASTDWGDYDNDGDLDLILTGSTYNGGLISEIYRNDYGQFTDISAGLTGVSMGSAVWGDYDNDGDLDIIIIGYSSSGTIANIYRNDNGAFTNIFAGLRTLYNGSADWGDYDNDGDLDLLLTGSNYTKIYKNTNGIFTDLFTSILGLNYSSASWGDYDNDGYLDVLLTGKISDQYVSKVYQNQDGTFYEVVTGITGISNGSAAWGDYDNDGDLDILIAGSDTEGEISKIYENYTITPNTIPSTPGNLQTFEGANIVTFSWDKATDVNSPQGGLSYNLYIGTAPGSVDKKSPMATLPTGYRKIVNEGIKSNNWSIKNLPAGTYYWSVQAIDNSFAGSGFASENSFIVAYSTSVFPIDEQTLIINQNGITLNVTESTSANSRQWKYSPVAGGPYSEAIPGATGLSYIPNFSDWGTYFVVCESIKDGVTYISNEVKINVPLFSRYTGIDFYQGNNATTAWGDYDNDGDLDLLLTAGYNTLIYNYDIVTDTFTEIYYGMIGSSYSYAAWGDYDNDGDLDAILLTSSGSRIYVNEAGGFTEAYVGLPSVYYGSMVVGDYDNDGDLDILVSGYISGIYSTRIYRNDSGGFTDIKAGLVGVRYTSVDWGDYDNDGDLDILLTGRSYGGTVSVIYRNDDGCFTDIMAGLPGVEYGSSAWGDYDSDGDLDVILSGSSSKGYITEIFRNDNGLFPNINAGLIGLAYSSVTWGDYDNDGDLDILLTGYLKSTEYLAKLYRNDNAIFTDINPGLPGFRTASLTWADYDRDGDLDIFMAGQSLSGYLSSLYINNGLTDNIIPTAPSTLQSVQGNNKVTLSWNKSTDTETLQNALSYNIYIGTAPATGNNKSPMAEIPGGYRKIVQKGKIQKNNWDIRHLHAGLYYWSVQAIDNSFAGSSFASEGTFSVPYSNSISPVEDQILTISTDGVGLNVYEDDIPASRQWKYSTVRGGPYNQVIAGATGATYIPNFATFGNYYVVCESVFNLVTYTSNEVKISVPVFNEQTGIILPQLQNSSVAWGDYDSDGDLDLLLTGYDPSGYISKVFNNNGGVFTDINADLIGIYYGSVSWGDYDNDNDLDILIMGYATTGELISKIYRNDSNIFTDINADLAGGRFSSASWADYDNDGDLDILLSCSNFSNIYRNDNGVFTDIEANLPGVNYSSAAWGDYDNDGDHDILLTGLAGENPISKIYRNDHGAFSDIDAGLMGVSSGSCAWGDYDSDGDPDILLTGFNGIFPVSIIYKNDGGVFTDINAGLAGVQISSVAWGDYDNDGDLDILLTGRNSTDGVSKIYNNAAGVFTDIGEQLDGVQYSSIAWGDYDNDLDLDIILTGAGPSTRTTKIYMNTSLSVNAVPGEPSNLIATEGANLVSLRWDKATDSQTLQNGLTYNLYIGTAPAPGASAIKSPMSGFSDGYRKIVQSGIPTNSWTIKNIPAGTYYWSVQAIDNSFVGSTFATESNFTVSYSNSVYPVANQLLAINQDGDILTVDESSPADSRQWKYSAVAGGPYDQVIAGATGTSYTPNFSSWNTYYIVCVSTKGGIEYVSNEVKITLPVFLEQSDIDLTGVAYSSVRWGDFDNDGDLDLLLAGWSTSDGDISKIYRNDAGQFTDIGAGLIGVEIGSLVWGDYDNDGDLDIFLCGYNESLTYITRIYRNDGGSFTDINAELDPVYVSSADWGDFDNDGDLDIVYKGRSPSGYVSKIYRNDDGIFNDTSSDLLGLYYGTVSWGDYDNDGDLDILMNGIITSGEMYSIIYNNEGGVFTNIDAGLAGVRVGSSAWGDYDNDGDLDILLTGAITTAGDRISIIYRNDDGVFTDINAGLPGVSSSAVAWGDYDNDGDLDILLSGSGSTGYISKVFRNDNGTFTDIDAGLPGSYWCSVAWGDYDNDGNLDIILSGYGSSGYISKIYRNTSILANNRPEAPANLKVSAISLSEVNLTWDKANDTETPQNSLTYNIRMGTVADGYDIVAPMALNTDGYRLIPAMGNTEFKNGGYIINSLSPGTYYWSVQSVDQGFAGSVWATESSFTLLEAPVADEATNKLYISFTANWNPSAGATGYRLDVSTDNTFDTFIAGYDQNDVGNITSVNVAGLNSNTTYYYRVWAYNEGGISIICSNVISATTLANPPQPPTGLSATSCNDEVTLTWNPAAEADFLRFNIYGGITANPYTLISSTADGVSVSSKLITGLTNNRTYYFRITTLFSTGIESDYSNEISIVVKTGFIPVIKSKWGDILICYNKESSIVDYQWYMEDTPISGATDQLYITNKQAGNYHVMITDNDGCKNSSNIIAISNSKSLSVYPNPASKNFTLSMNSEAQGETVISFYNAYGEKAMEYKTEKDDTELYREIPISSLQSGVYTIEVSVNNIEVNYSRIVIIQ